MQSRLPCTGAVVRVMHDRCTMDYDARSTTLTIKYGRGRTASHGRPLSKVRRGKELHRCAAGAFRLQNNGTRRSGDDGCVPPQTSVTTAPATSGTGAA